MVTARIDTSDFDAVIVGVSRILRGSLQKEMTDNLHVAGPKIVNDMKGAASTRIERRAASTIHMSRDKNGISLSGGRTGGLGAVLFSGAEYGGQKSKKKQYATRSPRGRAYAIKRRTTMQFKPHLGHEGYFFWPTIRDWVPKLEKIQHETVERAVGKR